MLVGHEHHADHRFRAPVDLRVTPDPSVRVLVVGGGLMAGVPRYLSEELDRPADYLVYYGDGPAPPPPRPLSDFGYRIVQLSLRALLPDQEAMRVHLGDAEAARRLFEAASERLDRQFETVVAGGEGLMTFVPSFFAPQQNPVGRTAPRYDLRNPAYLIERLNERLARRVAEAPNAWLVDLDQIAAALGRRHVQDDAVAIVSHGGVLNDAAHALDGALETPLSAVGEILPYEFTAAFCHEIEALRRTIEGRDRVELVIVDLDGAICRGGPANRRAAANELLEGWPLGVVEALLVLKARGLKLAVMGEGDPAEIEQHWVRVFEGRLSIHDFDAWRWGAAPKAEKVDDILEALSVAPAAAVMADADAAGREAVQAAHPSLRLIGENPYLIRRILLHAPETQRVHPGPPPRVLSPAPGVPANDSGSLEASDPPNAMSIEVHASRPGKDLDRRLRALGFTAAKVGVWRLDLAVRPGDAAASDDAKPEQASQGLL